MVTAIIPSSRVDKALEFINAQENQIALMQKKLHDLKYAVLHYRSYKTDGAVVQDELLRFAISSRLDKYLTEINNLYSQLELL